MSLVLITPPASEPLMAVDVRRRLGLAATISDDVLDPLIKGATQEIDGANGWLGRALITQTWELRLDYFPYSEIAIPLPPLQSIVSIKYDDTAGVEQTLVSTAYRVLQGNPARVEFVESLMPAVYWRGHAVRIRFIAGYGDGSDIPEPILGAITDKVGLFRALNRADPALRSETAEGIGSQSWSTGGDYVEVKRSAIDEKLKPYRVWAAET